MGGVLEQLESVDHSTDFCSIVLAGSDVGAVRDGRWPRLVIKHHRTNAGLTCTIIVNLEPSRTVNPYLDVRRTGRRNRRGPDMTVFGKYRFGSSGAVHAAIDIGVSFAAVAARLLK